jgi:Tfp pilus assembly protein PilO
MSVETLITITIAILSVLIAPLAYIWRSVMNRLDKLEENQQTFVKEEEVRNILNDKVTPIADNLEEVKTLLYKIIDIQMKK